MEWSGRRYERLNYLVNVIGITIATVVHWVRFIRRIYRRRGWRRSGECSSFARFIGALVVLVTIVTLLAGCLRWRRWWRKEFTDRQIHLDDSVTSNEERRTHILFERCIVSFYGLRPNRWLFTFRMDIERRFHRPWIGNGTECLLNCHTLSSVCRWKLRLPLARSESHHSLESFVADLVESTTSQ